MKDVRCPDCGKVTVKPDVFSGGRPISAVCHGCGERLYFDEPQVFTNCNVCGIKLRTEAEDQIGMCDRCAGE